MSAVSALRDTGLFSEAFRGERKGKDGRQNTKLAFRKLCPFRNGVSLVPLSKYSQ